MKVDILVFTLLVIYQYAYAQQNREKLTDVKTLTLKKGLMTTGRRTKPVLQAQCQDTSSVRCYNNEPDVIQCENVGNNGPYVNWKCTANLPLNTRFAEIKVICEGYDGPADPYVLKGSCGLKYKLEKYQSVQQPTTNKNNNILNIKNNNNNLLFPYLQQNKVKMTDLKQLTFKKGAMTTARRTSAVSQAQCVDSKSVLCASVAQPNTIDCKIVGINAVNIIWECRGELPTNIRFDDVKVSCEGYDYPGDSYVLVGSCGLKYTLDRYKTETTPAMKNNNNNNLINYINLLNTDTQKNKVKLTDVKQLTFTKGAMTTGRRTSPVLQAQCVDSASVSCGSITQPNAIDCKIAGINGDKIIWECRGNLPENIRFDDLKVSCEGYDYPSDPYVLTGSCGLKYTLEKYKTETPPSNNNNNKNLNNIYNPDSKQQNKVPMTDVKQLTFKKGAMTTAKRVSPILQSQCIDSNSVSCSSVTQPNTIDCKVVGIKEDKAIWECRGELPEDIRFDDLKVSCEGYDYPSDPYVLIGSCGLKYTLERYKSETPSSSNNNNNNNNFNNNINSYKPDTQQNKVKLADVKKLAFTKGAMTTARRSSPVLQIQCVDDVSVACSSVALPNTIECENTGSYSGNINWNCKANFPNGIRFAKTVVTCEGYDNSDDPFILFGSCGLKYSLEAYQSGNPPNSNNNWINNNNNNNNWINSNNNWNNNNNFVISPDLQNRVSLASLQRLTFTKGALTTRRRYAPVRQAQCIDSFTVPCYGNEPNQIECVKSSYNDPKIIWNCRANLPPTLRLGDVKVDCEGYDNPNDIYIVSGSCYVKYTLENQYGVPPNNNYNNNFDNSNRVINSNDDNRFTTGYNDSTNKESSTIKRIAIGSLIAFTVLTVIVTLVFVLCVISSHRGYKLIK